MYTHPAEAKSEIWRRWNNINLRKRVNEYLGDDIPLTFQQCPKGFLARFIVTPNFEFCNFTRLASSVNLSPVAGEFRSDKFYSVNVDKKHLGKISIYHGESPPASPMKECTKSYKILDFRDSEGKEIESLNTVWGQNIVEFHHQLTRRHLGNLETIDISGWLGRQGAHPESFYSKLLALFICYAVQFENYHQEGREAKFTQDIVRPAFQAVTEHFGLQPLIVPVVPIECEHDPVWSWYSPDIEHTVKRNMTRHNNRSTTSSQRVKTTRCTTAKDTLGNAD